MIMNNKSLLWLPLAITLTACGGGSSSSAQPDDKKGSVENAAPTAANLAIGGDLAAGNKLTGIYQYSDNESDAEGTSTFRWLVNGSTVATEKSYTIQAGDAGKTIIFEVTPIASTGTLKGQAIQSAASNITPLNASPVASAITITDVNGGKTWAGDKLSGEYSYTDAESDAEGKTTYRWLIDGKVVSSTKSYISSKTDAGKSITFEVTPVATTGTKLGRAVTSELAIKRDLHFFTANTQTLYNQLFVTDGTEAGTINLEVKLPNNAGKPVKLGDKWYFASLNSDSSAIFVTSTDGTIAGTQLFSEGPNVSTPYAFTEFKGNLYFSGRDEQHGAELWKTDGTEAGTKMFFETDASSNSGRPLSGAPATLIVAGDQLFFSAYQRSQGRTLWVTDGDDKTQSFHKWEQNTGFNIKTLFGFKGSLYFVDPFRGKLWKTNGTSAGTAELDLERKSKSAHGFIAMGENFFFIDSATGSNSSIWVSDGITNKPLRHSDHTKGQTYGLTAFNEKVYFTSEQELYEATATEAKKVDLSASDLAPGVLKPNNYAVLNNKLIFSASHTGSQNHELFQYDGAAVSLIKDITGDSASSYPGNLTLLNNEVIFSANDQIAGKELWKTDATEAGTVLLKDVKEGSLGSSLNLAFQLSSEL